MPRNTQRGIPKLDQGPPSAPRGINPPTDRAMQWGDLTQPAQVEMNKQMRGLGSSRSDAPAQQQRLTSASKSAAAASMDTSLSPSKRQSAERSKKKADSRLISSKAFEPTFTDSPITHQGAAAHRTQLVKQAGERTQSEGTSTSADWYFRHNKRLDLMAHATGYDTDRLITASAVMSPQNSPENEVAAASAMAMAHANDAHVTIGAGAAGAHPAFGELAGTRVSVRDLPPDQVAALSSAQHRGHIHSEGLDLDALGKGGTKENIAHAVSILRGDTDHSTAIDPTTSPKVWSYRNAIAMSKHGSAEHTEFSRRMDAATGLTGHGEIPGQTSMDLMPEMRSATHGPLNPKAHTAEDTWQQAISTRQQLQDAPTGKKGRASTGSPAKFAVGEGGSASQKMLHPGELPGMTNVSQSQAMHAWQNQATHRSAETLSRQTGEIIPAIGVQAAGWTEGRRQANANVEEQTPLSQQFDAHRQISGQGSMFTPKGNITKAATLPKENRLF